ncbi:MAG: hypothetical protein K2F52_01660 [Malacoplasma sp.]|nr:hypothetical protein [Malacoplasma sp.]
MKEIIREVPVEVVKEIVKDQNNQSLEITTDLIKTALKERSANEIREIINELPQYLILEAVKNIPLNHVQEVVQGSSSDVVKEIIKEVPVEVVREIIREVPVEVVKEVVKEVPVDKVQGIIQEVPTNQVNEIVSEISLELLTEVLIGLPPEIAKEILQQVPADVINLVVAELPESEIENLIVALPPDLVENICLRNNIVTSGTIKEVPIEIVKEAPPVTVYKEITVPIEVIKEVKVYVAPDGRLFEDDQYEKELELTLSNESLQAMGVQPETSEVYYDDQYIENQNYEYVEPENIPTDVIYEQIADDNQEYVSALDPENNIQNN